MTIIIKLSEEDLCNATKICSEIDHSLSASIIDVSSNHYVIDTGAVKIDSVGIDKTCTIDIDSNLLSFITDPMLDIISMIKMIGRAIVRMLDDKFFSFFKNEAIITKNGKRIYKTSINKDSDTADKIYNV